MKESCECVGEKRKTMKNKNNVIIVFDNQKGGVGKSTLCLFLENYLVYWKKNVCVIDTDLQQSASLQRQIDEQQFGTEPPYAIQSFPIADTATMQQLMENAQEFDASTPTTCWTTRNMQCTTHYGLSFNL